MRHTSSTENSAATVQALIALCRSHRRFAEAEMTAHEDLLNVANKVMVFDGDAYVTVDLLLSRCIQQTPNRECFEWWAFATATLVRKLAAGLSPLPARALIYVAHRARLFDVTWEQAYAAMCRAHVAANTARPGAVWRVK